MKKNKDFLDFLLSREVPPQNLQWMVQKDIGLSFRGSSIVGKFIGLQLLGALVSLSFCPQFGVGLMDGHGVTHIFRMIGDWACALFCGSLFLTMGTVSAYIGMKGEELWWIWRRYKLALIFLPAVLWGTLMLFNLNLNLPSEKPSYHLIWLVAAVFSQFVWLQLRSRFYLISSK